MDDLEYLNEIEEKVESLFDSASIDPHYVNQVVINGLAMIGENRSPEKKMKFWEEQSREMNAAHDWIGAITASLIAAAYYVYIHGNLDGFDGKILLVTDKDRLFKLVGTYIGDAISGGIVGSFESVRSKVASAVGFDAVIEKILDEFTDNMPKPSNAMAEIETAARVYDEFIKICSQSKKVGLTSALNIAGASAIANSMVDDETSIDTRLIAMCYVYGHIIDQINWFGISFDLDYSVSKYSNGVDQKLYRLLISDFEKLFGGKHDK